MTNAGMFFEVLEASAASSNAVADCFKAKYRTSGEEILSRGSWPGGSPFWRSCIPLHGYIKGDLDLVTLRNVPDSAGKVIMAFSGSGETYNDAVADGLIASHGAVSKLKVIARQFPRMHRKARMTIKTKKVGYHYFIIDVKLY